MTNTIQISGHLVRPLSRFMDARGVQNVALRHKVDAAQAESRINIERWWHLLEEMQTHVHMPALGIQIGRHYRIEDMGVLGHLAASCNTLSDAFLKLQRYEPLLHNLSSARSKVLDDGFYIVWEAYGNISTVISNDIAVSSLITLSNHLVGGEPIRPLQVELAQIPAAQKTEYEQLLDCEVRITEDTLAIKFPIRALKRTIDSSNPHLSDVLEQQAESMLASVPKPDAFLQSVQEQMVLGLETGELNIGWLARQLNMSERGIYRSFAQRGRKYQELLDSLRAGLATRYLVRSELSLAEISLILGYSEQSVFARAFKKWTGETPLRFRKNNSPAELV